MKQIIKSVLDRYTDKQVNLGSEAAREMIAAEITAALLQSEQIKQITRELYKGEG